MSDAFSFTAGVSLDLTQFRKDIDRAAEYARAAFANLNLGMAAGLNLPKRAVLPAGTLLDSRGLRVEKELSASLKEASDGFDSAGRAVEGMAEACKGYTKAANAAGAGLAKAARVPVQPKAGKAEPVPVQPAPQQRAGGGIGPLGGAMIALPGAAMLASMFTRPFKAAFDNFASRESLAINLGTLLGDDERGAAFQKRLQDYAAHTPYAQNDLAGTAQTLLQYGATEDDAETYLKQLGDIAMGDRNKFSSLGLALGQVQSVGRLQGQDLLQMINAGFNPLSVIAEETGRSMAELKDAMSKGEIGFDQVAMALRKATEEGGKFYKGAERGSKTFMGLISTITDNFSIALGTAVENSQGNLRTVLETWANFDWTALIESLSGMFRTVTDWATRLSGIVSTFVANRTAMDLATAGVKMLVTAIAGFKLANLVGLAKELTIFREGLSGLRPSLSGLRGKFDSLSKSATGAGIAMTGILWGLGQIIELGKTLGAFKEQKGKESDREKAQGEMEASYGLVKDAYDKWDASRKLWGDSDERTELNLKEFKRLNEEHEKALKGWTSRGSSGMSINANMKAAAGIKDEVKKAVAKDTKLTNVYAPTTNNVTQTNNISTDFNDIGKLVRENLIEILKSQLTFRRDREAMAGAGA